jgi:uncharacterized phosphosugar-binding protein
MMPESLNNTGARASKRRGDVMRYVRGLRDILRRIEKEDWRKIGEASTVIANAIMKGHLAYFVAEGHAPPLATSYGRVGTANIFLPVECLLPHFHLSPTVPMKGDVVVVCSQYDSGGGVDEIAARSKVLGAYVIVIGTPSDRGIVPITAPMRTLSEICDLTINVFTPPRDELLKFRGLKVGVLPTSGITSIVLYNILNIEVAERISRTIRAGINVTADPETQVMVALKGEREFK